MPKVVIVGAGISGLALAYRLTQLLPSVDVTVLEERNRPGGTIWTERAQGFQVEFGANGFRDTKPSTIELCRDLGLDEQLIPASEISARNRFLFLDGKLRRLGILSFLRSDVLSWRGKAAMLAEPLRRRKRGSHEESIHDFASRRFGREVAEVLIDAVVTGIYAGDPALLSVRASFPRLVAFEEESGSVIRGYLREAIRRRAGRAHENRPRRRSASMWSFREGMGLLIEKLAASLPTPPLLGVGVRRLFENPDRPDRSPRWTVQGEGSDRWSADAVVLTCPAHRQAEILAELDSQLAKTVGDIPYNRVAVVAFGFNETDVPMPLDGFGFITPERTRRDLLGVQWCSSIFPGCAPPGKVLLRAMCGGWNRPEIVSWDDDRLLSAVRAELQAAMNIRAAPVFHSIIRWDKAIPQYTLGHFERVSRIRERLASHPGLFLGGNGYHGVAVNDCTEQAQVLAQNVRSYLSV
jgi:oxygen-dependent protoporphyrinogen oxidase